MSSRGDDEQNNNQQSCQDNKTDHTADQTDHRGTKLLTHKGTSWLLVACLARITCTTKDTQSQVFMMCVSVGPSSISANASTWLSQKYFLAREFFLSIKSQESL